MSDFFAFLKSKVFFKHIGLAIISLILVLWSLFKLLNVYTHHGETAEVPNFVGKKIQELDIFIAKTPIRYQIIDSIYDPNEKPGMVIRQEPNAKSFVKHNRIIYLYVTSTQPPQIEMPKLVDRSLRQAVFMIESYGLKVGNIKEIKGDCNGCVLKQRFNGNEIMPGVAIKKGSKIDLEIGKNEFGYMSANADSLEVDSKE